MNEYSEKNQTLIERAKSIFGKQVEAIIRQEQKLVQPIQIFIRMIKAHFRGEHKIAFSTLGLIVLALVYFLSPVDFIPDFLGVFGFADDLSVILAVYAKVKNEVEQFLEWERTQV